MTGGSSTLLLPPPGRAGLGRHEPFWATLGRLFWTTLGHFGPLWTTLGRRRPEWATLERVWLRRTRDRPRQQPAAYAARPHRALCARPALPAPVLRHIARSVLALGDMERLRSIGESSEGDWNAALERADRWLDGETALG